PHRVGDRDAIRTGWNRALFDAAPVSTHADENHLAVLTEPRGDPHAALGQCSVPQHRGRPAAAASATVGSATAAARVPSFCTLQSPEGVNALRGFPLVPAP